MKFFGIAFALSYFGRQIVSVLTVDCGERLVPSAARGICIEPNYIQGCTSYANQNQCAECTVGYKVNNKRCDYIGGLSTNKIIPGCLSFNGAGQCINCANGFRRVEGSCKLGIRYCQKYDENGKCLDCRNDYSMVLGYCKHNLLLGCRSEQSDHTCKECFAPFRMNGNHCDIPHCKNYNDYGCVGCQCGYYLTAEKNCKEVKAGCIRYQRGQCSNCLPHYKLKGGSCQIDGCAQYQGNKCQKCLQSYEKSKDGGCKFKNCYDWLDGKCLVCQKGFRKQNDQCVKVNTDSLKCN